MKSDRLLPATMPIDLFVVFEVQMTQMKQSEFAILCGVSRAAVSGWRKAGDLVMSGALVEVEATHAKLLRFRKNGSPLTGLKVGNVLLGATISDKPASDSDYAPADPLQHLVKPGETIDQAAARLSAQGPDEMSFDDARRLKEYWLMRLNELEYDQKSRLVVLVEDVAKVVGKQFAIVRTRLRSIGPEHGAQISRLKTPLQASTYVSDLIDEALRELTADQPGIRWDQASGPLTDPHASDTGQSTTL